MCRTEQMHLYERFFKKRVRLSHQINEAANPKKQAKKLAKDEQERQEKKRAEHRRKTLI